MQETMQQLEDGLSANIYIKQIYTAPIYCQPPRFAELVCVQRLLVRPQFSKKPYTDVQTTLSNPKGKVIGKFTFDSSKAKLVNFPFPENSEQPAGLSLQRIKVAKIASVTDVGSGAVLESRLYSDQYQLVTL